MVRSRHNLLPGGTHFVTLTLADRRSDLLGSYVKQNWLKLVDKAGLVLRGETVIDNPQELQRAQAGLALSACSAPSGCRLPDATFQARRICCRCREISLQANAPLARTLDVLAAVDCSDVGQKGAATPDHHQEGCRNTTMGSPGLSPRA